MNLKSKSDDRAFKDQSVAQETQDALEDKAYSIPERDLAKFILQIEIESVIKERIADLLADHFFRERLDDFKSYLLEFEIYTIEDYDLMLAKDAESLIRKFEERCSGQSSVSLKDESDKQRYQPKPIRTKANTSFTKIDKAGESKLAQDSTRAININTPSVSNLPQYGSTKQSKVAASMSKLPNSYLSCSMKKKK